MSVVFEKDPYSVQRPASLVKVATAQLALAWVGDASLDVAVAVTGADVVNPATNSNMGLQAGDVLSYRDLLYGLFLVSANDAANCLARTVGPLIIAGDGPGTSAVPATRFVQAMNAWAQSRGMTATVFADASGFSSSNLSSAADIATGMAGLVDSPVLASVAGAISTSVAITGPNARTATLTNIVDMTSIPEATAWKNGWTEYSNPELNSGACLVVSWEASTGQQRITAVLGGTDGFARADVRKLINYEKARLARL